MSVPESENRPKRDLITEFTSDENTINELVEKYDAESRYRKLTGYAGKFITAWLCAMSLFHLATAGLITLPVAIQRSIHLTFAIVAVYVLYPCSTKGSKTKTPWYDWFLAFVFTYN